VEGGTGDQRVVITTVEDLIAAFEYTHTFVESQLTSFGQAFSVRDETTGRFATVPLCMPLRSGMTDVTGVEIACPMVHAGITLHVHSPR
jgi:hypothetical protein